MERHNEQQKMELRLKEEKRKEEALKQKSQDERAEMQNKDKRKFCIQRKFTLNFFPWFPRKNQQFKNFAVYLHTALTEEEIMTRMLKGFEDI